VQRIAVFPCLHLFLFFLYFLVLILVVPCLFLIYTFLQRTNVTNYTTFYLCLHIICISISRIHVYLKSFLLLSQRLSRYDSESVLFNHQTTTTTLCSKKSDAKIQITITTAYLIRIKYPLSGFNYHLSDVNFANFNKIHCTVFEQQLF